jgi:hypothetical protein
MRLFSPLSAEVQKLAEGLAQCRIDPQLTVDLYAHIPHEHLQEVLNHWFAFRLAWHMAKQHGTPY